MAQELSLLFLSLVFLALPAFSASMGFRAQLIRTDTSGDINKAVERSNRRMAAISAKLAKATGDVQAPVRRDTAEFIMDLAIGTPAVPFSAIVDTGSDLIWTQCTPCKECFPQPTPLFDPSKSSTFSPLPCSSPLCAALNDKKCSNNQCNYLYMYGDRSSTQGVLASETFTFGGVSTPGIGFGCGTLDLGNFFNSSGLVGLGMGPLSLASQLGAGKFSYCLDSDVTKTSPLLFGSLAAISNPGAQSTPIYQNQLLPSLYYLNLTGISVGDELLPIPPAAFAIQDNGVGGVIIDSGTTLTELDEGIYDVLRKAFVSKTSLPEANASVSVLDLCFLVDSPPPPVRIPTMTLHFEGADVNLRVQQYLGMKNTDLLCLLINPTTSGISVLGNTLQLDTQILYDLQNRMLSFAPAQCDTL